MKLLKLLKTLIGKGFATKAEKLQVKEMAETLDAEEREAVAEEIAQVENLPEEDNTNEETKKMLKSLMGENLVELKKEIAEWLKAQKELMDKQAGLYAKDVKPTREKINKDFKSFVKALLSEDKTMLKEMSTDGTSSPYAGYAVNSELSAEIRHFMTEYGVARREMTNLTLTKNEYKANTLATDVVTYWVDEGGAIKSTQAVLSQKSLKLKKLGAIACLTSELIEDEEIDLFAFLGQRVAEKMAEAEDLAFFIGDGTSTYGGFTGIIKTSGIAPVVLPSTKTAFSDITADALLDMQDAIPSSAQVNAKYYLHRTILSYIRKLKGSDGQYVYQAPSGNLPATIWNKPYVLTEVMPKASDSGANKPFVAYGDLRAVCILGNGGGLVAKRFDAGSIRNVADNADINLITTDREAIRWIERVGYVVLLPAGISVLKTATS